MRTRGHDRAETETETETARRAAPPLRSAAQLFKRRIAQALRAAARGRYEYISTCFLFAQTGNHTNKQKLGLCEYIDIFYFQMMISPIKRSRSSVSCAGRRCIFCSFVVSNTHAHRQLDCSRETQQRHFFLHSSRVRSTGDRASCVSALLCAAHRDARLLDPLPSARGLAATPSPPRSTAARSSTRQPSRPPRAPTQARSSRLTPLPREGTPWPAMVPPWRRF